MLKVSSCFWCHRYYSGWLLRTKWESRFTH